MKIHQGYKGRRQNSKVREKTWRWREDKFGRRQRSAKIPLRKACPMCPRPSDMGHPGPIGLYLHLQVTVLNGSDIHSLYNVSGEQVRIPSVLHLAI
jgi:hypothetical protein